MAACARSFKAVLPAATNKAVQELTVVTYNILADKYAMGGHHAYCQTEHLQFTSRAPRLINEISNYKADILCLQEVERPFMEDELGPKLRSMEHDVRNKSSAENLPRTLPVSLINKTKVFLLLPVSNAVAVLRQAT